MKRLSNGGANCARDCKRKYYHRYEQAIQRRRDDSHALYFGRIWALVMACWFTERALKPCLDIIEREADNRDDSAKLEAMISGYAARWPEHHMVTISEGEFDVPIRNPATGRPSLSFTQYGFVDLLELTINNDIWLWEHKTAGTIDGQYIEKLWCDSQITSYAVALRGIGIDIKGVVYDVVKKTKIKQRIKDTPEDYHARLMELYLTDESMFHRETVILSDSQIADWKADLWQTTQEILACRRAGIWPRNTSRCYDWHRPCEFVPLCQNGADSLLLETEYEPRTKREDNDTPKPQPAF